MIPLTRRDVLAHQAHAPWPTQRQIEQDLLLCRSMAALFDDKFLHGQVAMRGGTLLHKVHLAPPCRYSEDIDLVLLAIGLRIMYAKPFAGFSPMCWVNHRPPFGRLFSLRFGM